MKNKENQEWLICRKIESKENQKIFVSRDEFKNNDRIAIGKMGTGRGFRVPNANMTDNNILDN